jgi:hypothetical protein
MNEYSILVVSSMSRLLLALLHGQQSINGFLLILGPGDLARRVACQELPIIATDLLSGFHRAILHHNVALSHSKREVSENRLRLSLRTPHSS